jgi:hypothetical protein
VDQNEKLAVQTVIMEELTRRMADEPTLLIDVLMSGQGQAFVLNVLSQQAGDARRRTETLSFLLKKLMGNFENREPDLEKVA